MKNWNKTIPAIVGLFILLTALLLPYVTLNTINAILLKYPGLDKIAHFIEHFFIVIGAYWLLGKTRIQPSHCSKLIIAVSVSLIFSITDEAFQGITSGRSFEYSDILANTLGCMFGFSSLSFSHINHTLLALLLTSVVLTISFLTYNSYLSLKPYYHGMQLEREGKFQQAMDQYLLALQQGNTSAGLFNAIAWLDLAFLDGDRAQALAFSERAVQMDPDNGDFIDTYGLALLENKRAKEALVQLERAYEINPDIYTIHYHLAKAYDALGERGKAVYHFTKQVERTPNQLFGIKAQTFLDRANQTSTP